MGGLVIDESLELLDRLERPCFSELNRGLHLFCRLALDAQAQDEVARAVAFAEAGHLEPVEDQARDVCAAPA